MTAMKYRQSLPSWLGNTGCRILGVKESPSYVVGWRLGSGPPVLLAFVSFFYPLLPRIESQLDTHLSGFLLYIFAPDLTCISYVSFCAPLHLFTV